MTRVSGRQGPSQLSELRPQPLAEPLAELLAERRTRGAAYPARSPTPSPSLGDSCHRSWHRVVAQHDRVAPLLSAPSGRIAVKVINHYGDEILKVCRV